MSDDVIEGEEGDAPVVSERVQALAQGIYDELQGIMDSFGQETISNLMPLVVNVLENLDSALADNQDHLAALMEVNEENETLMKQYDREKQRRKEIEEKLMRLEDANEGEIRDIKSQMSKVQSGNRGMGAKMASQKEQIDRLEDRCEDLLREKKELHDKNIGLIKNFHDQMGSLSARRLSETRKVNEEGVSSSTRPRGFQDFMAPAKGAGRKKRTLPIAPHRRNKSDGDEEEEALLGVTPSGRPDSPEFSRGDGVKTPPNLRSLHEEQTEDEEEGEEGYEEDPNGMFRSNEDSLLDELHLATTGSSATGVDQIITENEELMATKNQLTREVDNLTTKLTSSENDKKAAETELVTVQTERDSLSSRTAALEGELKRLRRELEDEKEKTTQLKEAEEKNAGDGLRLTKLEVARVLRERNEYKEKYLSLLEQVRMNDELYLFKKSKKSSRWVDYFAALFSPAKRRQLEKVLDGTTRRPILGARTPDVDEEDGGEAPQAGPAGFCMTHTIPTLRRGGKRQEELLMTSVSWLTPPSTAHHSHQSELQTLPAPLLSPGINTCRPMSFQEDGAKVLCVAAVNPATFLSDHGRAITVAKHVTPPPEGVAVEKGRPPINVGVEGEGSMSLVWIITGVPNLTKVSVLDAAAMGEVLETFIVSSTPIDCITGIPAFDDNDPDVLTSLSSARRRSNAITESTPSPTGPDSGHPSDIPSSRLATMWMGSDQGVLYVHSAVTQWRRCIHADKLPAAIKSIVHVKGKVFVLLANSSVAVFRRFPDGGWDWDNYSVVYLTQKKDLPVTAIASVKFNIWCAIGNSIHVVHSHLLKMEATFAVHSRKRSEVGDLVVAGEGVWISFKQDSTLRLYNGTTFNHMQDLDIAPAIRRNIVFGGEKRSHAMAIQISSLVAAHNCLWVGTENGILLTCPFNAPSVVAEETGWEVIKEAEVIGGAKPPEPFDVRMEQAEEAGSLLAPGPHTPQKQHRPRSPVRSIQSSLNSLISKVSSITPAAATTAEETPLPPQPHSEEQQQQMSLSSPPHSKPFHPFCEVDQSEISIHCHINAVRALICVPGMVPQSVAIVEPLQGIVVGTGDSSKLKPALFVVSCGEGHLDLRTADKVLETLQAKESGQSGLPDAASIISEKNYIMVWDVMT